MYRYIKLKKRLYVPSTEFDKFVASVTNINFKSFIFLSFKLGLIFNVLFRFFHLEVADLNTFDFVK